jgi:hypothetical protein
MYNLVQSSSLSPSLRGPYDLEKRFSVRTMIHCDESRLFRITSGVVRTLTYLDDGTPVVFGLWGPGDAIGGMLSHVNPYYLESFTPV